MQNLLTHLAATTRRPIIIEMLFDRANPLTLEGLAANPHMSEEDISRIYAAGGNIAGGNIARVQSLLAKHPRIPENIFDEVCKTPHKWVLDEIATTITNNPNTPTDVLFALKQHPHSLIALRAQEEINRRSPQTAAYKEYLRR